MRKLFLTMLWLCSWSALLVAQTARLQVIHNSPSPTVDVYANGSLLLDDFVYRTATPFIDVPAGVAIDIAVAPGNSTSVADAIFVAEDIVLDEGVAYTVIANGIVGNADTPFGLAVNANARESASGSGVVAINAFHGSPDAPAVDVAARTVGNLFTNLAYGNFSASYLEVPPGQYYLDVKPAGNSAIVATFLADLNGLGGGAATVFASGLLGDDPAFGLFAALPNGTVVELPASPVARLQVIHNSPSPTVDVYVNGGLFIDDFEYRTATAFQFVPAGVALDIAVAPGNSTSAADAIFVAEDVTLDNGGTYTVIANGIVGNVDTPFGLAINATARESASGSGVVAINAFHGSPDAPAVDVAARTVGNLFTNLAYGNFSASYLEVPPGQYYLDVKPAGNSAIVATFLADLNGLGGGAATVFASGLLGDDPAFGLFAALPNGTVVELPASPVARLQVIHNSPSPTVDVYVNGGLFIDDFVYRTATAFQFVPAGVALDIAVAPGNSTSAADAIFVAEDVTLDNGGTYTVIANGIVGNVDTPFGLAINATARESASGSGVVAINAFHGSPNAPAVDVAAQNVGDLFTNLVYGSFSADYLEVPAASYVLDVKPAGSPDVVASFTANLSGLGGGAATVFASGLLGGDPSFGLFAALPDGTVVELPIVPVATPTARLQVIHNSPSPTVDVYANGSLLLDDFVYRTATPFIDVPAGVAIDIAVAPGNSTSVADAIFVAEDIVLDEGVAYTVIANGIVGNVDTPFGLAINATARESASGSGVVAINAFHGSPNAPAVDVAAQNVGDLFTNLVYGSFSADYLEVPAASYVLDVKPAGSPDVVASFTANLSGLGGGAATVFASGLLGGDPSFGLFAALPDGTVVELPIVPVATPTARLQVIHNSPSPTVDVYANGSLLLDDFVYRTATPFIDVPAGVAIDIAVAPGNSTSAADAIFVAEDIVLDEGVAYTVIANGIAGNADTPFGLAVNANARESASGSGVVAINAFHGSPNAPAVDVAAQNVGDLFTNLVYGSFSADYLEVPAASYVLDVKPAGSPDVVASFTANLSGLGGGAATVFASGLLGGDPSFGLFAALPDGTVVELPIVPVATPTARLQVIHNSPSPTVDVYANGSLLLDDFVYRTATPFIDVPAGVAIDIAVAPGNSTSAADAIFVAEDVIFDPNGSYIVIANGIVGNADTPFGLAVLANARETAQNNQVFEAAIFHGAQGVPTVDVTDFAGGTVADDLAYGEFTDYLELDPISYVFELRDAEDEVLLGSFFIDIEGAEGVSGLVFASGLPDEDPLFNLLVALPNGAVVPFLPVSQVQVIHNSPAPIASVVDLYAGVNPSSPDDFGPLLEDLAFRSATPYLFYPTRLPITIGVAGGDSEGPEDILITLPPFTLDDGKFYTAIANGIPGDVDSPFGLAITDEARPFTDNPGLVGIRVFHGSPGAPAVDVDVRGVGQIITNLSYGDFSGYLEAAGNIGYLEVNPAGSNALVGTFEAGDLSILNGLGITVFASGLLGEEPLFGLFAALPNGDVVELTPVSRVQIIHNSPSPTVDVFVNGERLVSDFTFRSATPLIDVPTRTALDIAVSPAGAGIGSAVATYDDVVLEDGKVYSIMATGIVGNAQTPFELLFFDEARDRASEAGNVDVLLYHGSPDAPEVDVTLTGGAVLFDNVAYGEFADYISVPAASYSIDVTPADDNSITVKRYLADISAIPGQAITAFASGFLNENQPGFEVWVALPNGITAPLEEIVASRELNLPISVYELLPNPASTFSQMRYTLDEATTIDIVVTNALGQPVFNQRLGQQSAGEYQLNLPVSQWTPGAYQVSLRTAKGIVSKTLMVTK